MGKSKSSRGRRVRPHHVPPGGGSFITGELAGVMIVAQLSDPDNPPCPGVVVIHVDGSFGCASCGSVADWFHDDDQLEPCTRAAVADLGDFHCRRCRDRA